MASPAPLGTVNEALLYPRSIEEERRLWISHVIAQAHREGRVLDGDVDSRIEERVP